MLNGRRSQILAGSLLFAVGLLGIAPAGAREVVRHTKRHVTVGISNVDGIVQVAVNCEQAIVVTTGEARVLDLGFLSPGDEIFISVISDDHHPSWGFRIASNGRTFFEEKRGQAKTPLSPPTEANAVVFARAFTAGGEERGSIGCQKRGLVSVSDVPGYAQSPDDHEVPAVSAEKSPFRPRHFPYETIDLLGRWSLPALAVLGAIAAIGTPSIRRFAWSHNGGLATGALAVLSAGVLQIVSLPAILVLAGIALFFAVASLLVLGEPRVRRWRARLQAQEGDDAGGGGQ